MFLDVLLIALGGGLGAVLRYLVTLLVYGKHTPAFPYGTLVVNLLGCLGIGLLAGYFHKHPEPMYLKFFAITGILGGFTTFSTFSLETFNLLAAQPFQGLLNMGISILAGLALVGLGLKISGL